MVKNVGHIHNHNKRQHFVSDFMLSFLWCNMWTSPVLCVSIFFQHSPFLCARLVCSHGSSLYECKTHWTLTSSSGCQIHWWKLHEMSSVLRLALNCAARCKGLEKHWWAWRDAAVRYIWIARKRRYQSILITKLHYQKTWRDESSCRSHRNPSEGTWG